MTDEEVLQQAIAKIRLMSSQYSSASKTQLSPEEDYILTISPNILSILRVALKCIQIEPELAKSVNGYAREVQLAKSIIYKKPEELVEEPEGIFDDNSDI